MSFIEDIESDEDFRKRYFSMLCLELSYLFSLEGKGLDEAAAKYGLTRFGAVPPTTQTPPSPRRISFSPREKQVLQHFISGHSNKVVARDCNISEATVKVHAKGIYRKLGVINRTQAALWARENIAYLE